MFDFLKRLFRGGRSRRADRTVKAYEEGKGRVESLIASARQHVEAYVALHDSVTDDTFLATLASELREHLAQPDVALQSLAEDDWSNYIISLSEGVRPRLLTYARRSVDEAVRGDNPTWAHLLETSDLPLVLDSLVDEEVTKAINSATVRGALVVTRELDSARARSGMPPLNMPSQGPHQGHEGLQLAYRTARETVAGVRQDIALDLDARLMRLHEAYLEAFRQRLQTIRTRPGDLLPLIAYQTEWSSFEEHTSGVPNSLAAEIDERYAPLLHLADLAGIRPSIDDMVSQRLNRAAVDLLRAGESLYGAATRHLNQ